MNSYREQLEGTARLFRIRRLRRAVLVVLVLVLIALSAGAMASQGASLVPLYLPINAVLAIAVILLLLATVAGLSFRALELRYAKRDSQRYLIARASIRRAWGILILSAVVGVVLLVPWTARAFNDSLKEVQTRDITRGTEANFTFATESALALTRYASARIEVPGHQLVRGFVMHDGQQVGDFTLNNNSWVKQLDISPAEQRVEYTVLVHTDVTGPISVVLTIQSIVTPELTSVVPGLLLMFAVTEGVWIVYARPLRARYHAASIYSLEREQATEAGERTFAEYFRGPSATVEAESVPAPEAPLPETVPVDIGPGVPSVAEAPIPETLEPEPPPPEPTPEELIEEGSKLFSDGQLEAALALFDEVLEREPTNSRALVAGATALVRLGRGDEAHRQYSQVLEIEPRNAKALAGRARVFEGEHRWAQAAQAWAAYTAVVPADIDARVGHAEAILNTGDRAGAVRVLEDALFLAPSDPKIRAKLESLTVNVPAFLSRALVASASGRYEEALADFNQILTVEPDNVNALIGRGVALRRAGRADEALASFDLAIAKQPGNSAALHAKGGILEERQDFSGALDVYDDLLAWNPRDPDVWALQGAVLEKLGKPEEALASFMEALKLEPANTEWRKRADALESSRKGHEAFLEELFGIEGVGPARARALLAGGYQTADAIRSATEDEIANVKGMTRKIAKDIYRHFHADASAPTAESPAPARTP